MKLATTHHHLCSKVTSRAERAAKREQKREMKGAVKEREVEREEEARVEEARVEEARVEEAKEEAQPRAPLEVAEEEYPRTVNLKPGNDKWFCLGTCGWVEPVETPARIRKLLRIVDDLLALTSEQLQVEVKRRIVTYQGRLSGMGNDSYAFSIYYYIQDAGRHTIDILPLRVKGFDTQVCWRAGEGWSDATGNQLLYINYRLRESGA